MAFYGVGTGADDIVCIWEVRGGKWEVRGGKWEVAFCGVDTGADGIVSCVAGGIVIYGVNNGGGGRRGHGGGVGIDVCDSVIGHLRKRRR